MAFECPRGTRFQQRTMVCDHEHLVECHQSAKYFHSNLRIGQANVNFIDDKQRSSSKCFHYVADYKTTMKCHVVMVSKSEVRSS